MPGESQAKSAQVYFTKPILVLLFRFPAVFQGNKNMCTYVYSLPERSIYEF